MFGFLKRIVRPEAAVELTTPDGAAFADRVAGENIPLHNLKPGKNETEFSFDMRAADFKKLKPIVRRTGSKVRVRSKRGLAFSMKFLRGRYILSAGLLLFLGSFFLTTCVIWDIEVSGNSEISEKEVLANLYDIGVKPGTLSIGRDADKLANQMRLRLPKTSWLAVNIRGSRVDVMMRERTPVPLLIPENDPCDIVAKKAGLVTEARVYKGEAAVTAGRTVAAGQVLVNGRSVTANGVERLQHASADIFARTWTGKTCVLPVQTTITRPTGRSVTRRALVFGQNRVNLYLKGGNPYELCDKITEQKELSVFGIPLMVSVVTERFDQLEGHTAPTPEVMPDSSVRRWFENYLSNGVEGEMVGSEFSSAESGDLKYYRLECEFHEIISEKRSIDLGSVNIS